MHNLQKAILSSIICSILLWYEYTLFGVLISTISNTFFPSENFNNSVANLLIIFGIGFAFRPIGALIFGHISDKLGRRFSLLISVILVSVPSTLISLVPSYSKIGIFAPILITIFRIIHGIAIGGETSSSSAFLIEHSQCKKNLGFLGSIKIFSGPIGSILSFIVVYICHKYGNFDSLGWRIPFFLCFLLGAVSFFIRLSLEESPAYKANKSRRVAFPLGELIKKYRKSFIISIGIGIAQNVITYSIIMFFNIFIEEKTFLGIELKYPMRIINDMLFAVFGVIFAILSDKIGRKIIVIPILIFLILTSPQIFIMLSSQNFMIVIIFYLLSVIPISGLFGTYNAIICELFPTKVRCTALSLAHNLSAGIFGGFAPYICTFLINNMQSKIAAGLYLSLCAFISLISIMQIKLQDKKIDW
ncbi:MFS transporter [Wolbachia endosymbiont of Pentidionis agamae]|uniref:MFS transporter n=1 Tax=Wolbachia endosymbiont of Pentidionis agamae TaxID=3110435 RepID=UPI002FD6481E